MKKFLTVILTIMLLSLSCDACGKGKEFKLLYWNIQNGMWHDQGNGYDGFVKFVQELDPDICVWCEAESRYVTDKAVKMQMPEDQYLPWNWDILAARYGHKYTLICGKRDRHGGQMRPTWILPTPGTACGCRSCPCFCWRRWWPASSTR